MFPSSKLLFIYLYYLLLTIPSVHLHIICCDIASICVIISTMCVLAAVELVYFACAFSPMDLIFLCALLQTQLNGPLASFLMKRRENPMQILGMLATVIIALVFVTVLISTATFMRNKKSNKILPSQRIIKKKHRQCKQWNFYNPFKQQNNSERFMKESEVPENVNCNNNSVGVHHSPPLPPPLPGFLRRADRSWAVPTVSAPMAKQKSFRNKQSHVNTALVSELKLRLEQKKLINQY